MAKMSELTKEKVQTLIIEDLKKHFELLERVYGPDVDLCEKLVKLVHQCPRK